MAIYIEHFCRRHECCSSNRLEVKDTHIYSIPYSLGKKLVVNLRLSFNIRMPHIVFAAVCLVPNFSNRLFIFGWLMRRTARSIHVLMSSNVIGQLYVHVALMQRRQIMWGEKAAIACLWSRIKWTSRQQTIGPCSRALTSVTMTTSARARAALPLM